MSVWFEFGLWLHGPIATLSFMTTLTMSGSSSFGHAPAEKANKIATQLLNQMASELQEKLEKALDGYSLDNDAKVERIVLPSEVQGIPLTRATRILAVGGEAIRNELDDYLGSHTGLLFDWRTIRRKADRLNNCCSQFRIFCLFTLIVSIAGLLVSGFGLFFGGNGLLVDLSKILLCVSMPMIAATLIYVSCIVCLRNAISPYEARYDHLLA